MSLSKTLGVLLRIQWIEIHRTRLIYWSAAAACLVLGFSYFVRALALTESAQIGMVSSVALMRLTGVLLTVLFCAQSICRDLQDKTHLNILAQPISKTHWLASKLAGCALTGCCIGVVLGAALLVVRPANLLLWWISFMLELSLISLVAGLFALSFKQIGSAIFSAILIYLAGRLTNTFTELARTAIDTTWWENCSGYVIRAIDFILPKLSSFAQTDWLINPTSTANLWGNLALNLIQTLIYACLIMVMAAIDLKSNEW